MQGTPLLPVVDLSASAYAVFFFQPGGNAPAKSTTLKIHSKVKVKSRFECFSSWHISLRDLTRFPFLSETESG